LTPENGSNPGKLSTAELLGIVVVKKIFWDKESTVKNSKIFILTAWTCKNASKKERFAPSHRWQLLYSQ